MSELLDFARDLIELEGGAVETESARLVALLPEELSKRWQVGEELALCESEGGPQLLAYGSELLEHMLATATGELHVAAASCSAAAPRASQVRAAAERWTLRNGLVSAGDVRLCSSTRVQLFALATLHGDEKRELLVSRVMATASRTEVPEFERMAGELLALRHHASVDELEPVVVAAARACEEHAVALAEPFRVGMTRRFERDRERIEAYFEDLSRELDKRARRGKLDPQAVADKREALHADRAAKLEALAARFVLRIEVVPIAMRLIEVEGAFATVTLRRRKASRAIELEYDAATRKLVPPRCDGCARAAMRPAACDDALHLLCEACVPRAEGRVVCSACKPEQACKGQRESLRHA